MTLDQLVEAIKDEPSLAIRQAILPLINCNRVTLDGHYYLNYNHGELNER